MMSIKKSRFIKIFSIIAAILLLLVILCVCVPFLRHRVLRVPIETEEMLPMPNRISCFRNGQRYTFTKAQGRVLYNLLTHDEHQYARPSHLHYEWNTDQDTLIWQFDYYDTYTYTKQMPCQSGKEITGQPFNEIRIQVEIESVKFLFPDFDTHRAVMACDAALLNHLREFINMSERFVLASIIDTQAWEAENTTPYADTTFPAKPDEIYIYYNGDSLTLKGEECDAVYQKLMQRLRRYTSGGTFGHHGDSFEYTESADMCLELRYRQRQLYAPTDTEADRFTTLYNQKDYDALLFAIDFGKSGIDNPNGMCTTYVGVFGTSLNISYHMAREPSYIQTDFVQSLVDLF